MTIRFSCFNSDLHNKPKKVVRPSIEAMAKTLQDGSQSQASTNNGVPTGSTPLISNARGREQLNKLNDKGGNLISVERGWMSENLRNRLDDEHENEIRHTGRLKKSVSLESGLYQEGKLYTDNLAEDYSDHVLSYNDPESHNESTISGCRMDRDINAADRGRTNQYSEIHDSLGPGNDGSIFSIEDPTLLEKDAPEASDTPLSGGCAGDDHTSGRRAPTLMLKSCSFPNIMASALSSEIFSYDEHTASRSRSSEDLQALSLRLKDTFIGESDIQVSSGQARGKKMDTIEENHMDGDGSFDDVYDAHPLCGSARDWVMPLTDDINGSKTLKGESSVRHLDDLDNKDFRIKRIEDWVTGLEHYGPPEETIESSELVGPLNGNCINTSESVAAARVDGIVTPSMEAAKRYVSSLSPNATTAHLANCGLVTIPLLSVFVTLKVLNLSGNAIGRITVGALPRGLHVLNLSKNNISTIEGLRELTRLRVLDLSYNRILRIGHGLASCSSLKELYLAGNKISEVEGLHRLLKLNVLDLRFNKISTAKCLGQLAANYNSLQAISLEGNPAQKNVGNEQLKKYLQGLLPHLAYYNRQPMKAGTLKDGADRSVRLGMNAHQSDRSLRLDHKTARKGSHVGGSRRPSTPSTTTVHARRTKTVESWKHSKGKMHLPPTGAKVTSQSRNHFDVVGKLLNLGQGLSIRKSRSEGTLGAL
ncbi:uncharacterized protein LOC114720151 [Neltuma alba]|uniref:uncharacterized protein LOC114720151 n=1 Tax=Neltuma alba TaxID=207710 RepID=UPI0010A487F1|nr:uncharacterized protein LOC114720151 [Prosopis alba]XP_028761600.1 uncharacterized protein LOC114720151 [Prosopis alba]XP_028761601.1 uncharacterized protein LOC114720151 [Prosopis alba]